MHKVISHMFISFYFFTDANIIINIIVKIKKKIVLYVFNLQVLTTYYMIYSIVILLAVKMRREILILSGVTTVLKF